MGSSISALTRSNERRSVTRICNEVRLTVYPQLSGFNGRSCTKPFFRCSLLVQFDAEPAMVARSQLFRLINRTYRQPLLNPSDANT